MGRSDYIGLGELAGLLGMSGGRLRELCARNSSDIPPVAMRRRGEPYWLKESVTDWKRNRNRRERHQ